MNRFPHLIFLLVIFVCTPGFVVGLFAISNNQSLKKGITKKLKSALNRELFASEQLEISANTASKAFKILKDTAIPAIPKIKFSDAELLAKGVWKNVNHSVYQNMNELLTVLKAQISHELTLGAKEIVIKRSNYDFDTCSLNVIALLPNNVSGHFYRAWKIDDGRFVLKAAHKELGNKTSIGKYEDLIAELCDPYGPDRNYRPEYYKAQETLVANWKTSIKELFNFLADAKDENNVDGVLSTLYYIAQKGKAPCNIMAKIIGKLNPEIAKTRLKKILYCRQNSVNPAGAGGHLLRSCIANSKSYKTAQEFIENLGNGRFGRFLAPLVAEIMQNENLNQKIREKFSQILRSYCKKDCANLSTLEEMVKWWNEKGKQKNWND